LAERKPLVSAGSPQSGLAGGRGVVAVGLRHYTPLCVALGEPARAVRIFGATASIRKAPLLIHIPSVDEDIIASARRTLSDDEFAMAWTEGQRMTLEQVMSQIVGAPLDSEIGSPAQDDEGAGPWTEPN
jgi:hypothetical protein